MLDKDLSNAILNKQGELLFTTLAEECTELAQACCKINRQKFYKKDYINVLDNFFEELCDLKINLDLIKQQIMKETGISSEEYEKNIEIWKEIKQEKLKKIFKTDTIDEYYNHLIKAKYIKENGEPIKCLKCGSTNLKDKGMYHEEYYVVEYDRVCEDCGEIVGHWAYGYWMNF